MLNRTPKVHIVYCHPSEKSITNTIKQGYIDGLEEINIPYTITDLYGSNFNSDITEEEYLRENNNIPFPLAEDVIIEQEKINNADILTFIFPLFWMDAPSKLVGYFARVFTKGFKYDYDDCKSVSMNTMIHTNFLISAGSNYDDLEKDGKVNALETIFISIPTVIECSLAILSTLAGIIQTPMADIISISVGIIHSLCFKRLILQSYVPTTSSCILARNASVDIVASSLYLAFSSV